MIASNYTLGSYFGTETLNQEFKAHCLNSIQKYFDHDIIKNIFENEISKSKISKNIFNKMVNYDITNNIIEYLPKYIGNFSASNIFGQLHFGISDDGILDGIPYFKNKLNKRLIDKTIKCCFDDYLRSHNNDYNDVLWFKKNISYELTELTIDEMSSNFDYIFRLDQLKTEVANYIREHDQYKINFEIWLKSVHKYCIKLKTLLNDMNIRKEIVEFILEQNTDNSDKTYLKAIEYFNSNDLFVGDITHDMLKNCSDDDPLKWLVMFKDQKILAIKKNKPIQPLYKQSHINYYDFAKHLNNIRNYLMANDCKFYIITFTIPKHPTGKILEYKDKYNKWHCKMRLIDQYSGPHCRNYCN